MFWPLPCSGFLLSPGFNINEDGKYSLREGLCALLGAVALCSNTLNLFSEDEAEVHLRWQSRDWNPGLANLNDKPTQPGDFQQTLSHAH